MFRQVWAWSFRKELVGRDVIIQYTSTKAWNRVLDRCASYSQQDNVATGALAPFFDGFVTHGGRSFPSDLLGDLGSGGNSNY
jgi:hypothetical protein